jgi:hypothetical protein
MKDTDGFEADPDNIEQFNIPASMIEQLFEFTGSTEDNRGFILAHVNQAGDVVVCQRVESQIIDLGLRKALEKYLVDLEDSEGRIDLTGESGEE